ncbi:MAG: DUF3298 domain-containing protein [Bacteroidetes bacterium]|nr:DUF3298 domain-containing protein [Bacteroidota bacterium]
MKTLIQFFFLLFLFINSLAFGQELQVDSAFYKEQGIINKYAYMLDLKYPKFNFGPDALMGVRGIASDMNTYIDTLEKSWVKGFKENLNLFTYDTAFNDMTSELVTDYKTSYAMNSFVSIELSCYEFIAGTAHPNYFTQTYNFDFNACVLSFADLFKENSVNKDGYLKFVSEYCKKSLIEQQEKNGMTGMEDMISDGTAPKPDNYKNFVVDEKGITIIFNPYQAGPYAVGEQRVFIPKIDISGYVNSGGPLSFWWK